MASLVEQRPPVAKVSSNKEALEVLYTHLGGSQWARSENWMTSAPISEWCGVSTTATTAENGTDTVLRVKVLELSRNSLHGNLSSPFVVMALDFLSPYLEQLWLSENMLTGTLPPILAVKCPKLQIIDVGSNKLRGRLHPCFSSKNFNWFDVSGNELSSYFRYDAEAAAGITYSTCTTRAINLGEMSSQKFPSLWQAHLAPSLLNPSVSSKLIDLAEKWAGSNGGWMTARHRNYKTTDVDIAICSGELLSICNSILETEILPLMSSLFMFSVEELAIEDLFLAKYSAAEGAQKGLDKHRDGSELSFVLTLNDPQKDFSGGGTRFVREGNKADLLIAPQQQGSAVFFCGQHNHAGSPVSAGTRYILAGFVRIFPACEESKTRFAHIQQIRELPTN